ncbi:MAG TPA: hypothetical protein VMV49_05965 [Candidatus Deferrimicrobium sp.]|nr:hypothetical protein [Candidatus Deferrimicrobium sp.]
MSLQVIFDESHGEQISPSSCRGITYILEKLNIIPFRLVSAPITFDKIENEDALFLGGPTRQFLEFEINTIDYFVSKGKFVIIVCPVPIPFNFTLNELVIKFGIKFNYDIIQDPKHNLDGAMYFPLIKNFSKDEITQDLNEIVYSGCSLTSPDSDVNILAVADENATPPSAPIIMTAKSGRVICIGGSPLFLDDKRYGIKAKNNIRLVANIFRAIIQQRDQRPKEQIVKQFDQSEKIEKLKLIDLKRAKKIFEKLADNAIQNLKKVTEAIDGLFEKISKIIDSKNFPLAENSLNDQYSKFKSEIEKIYADLINKHDDLSSRIEKNQDFPTNVKEISDQVLITESEALSKLDMIRFNLANRISSEKSRLS